MAGLVAAPATATVGGATLTEGHNAASQLSDHATTLGNLPAPPQSRGTPFIFQVVLSPSLAGAKYGDVLSMDAHGDLWRAPGSASGKLGKKVKISSMPNWYYLYAPGDWNSDGKNDLIGVESVEGIMYLFRGDGKGGVGPKVQIGHGWSKYRIIPVGDLTGDKNPDLLAINQKTGALLLYTGNGKGGFKPGYKQVGHGWKKMQLFAAGDLNKDGKMDILGVKADGTLLFYAGKGAGTFKPGKQVGHGWRDWEHLAAGADINGDGIADIVKWDERGRMHLYKGKGGGGFYKPIEIAAGF